MGYELKLPCKVGDTIYYVTEWDKYSRQLQHQAVIKSIMITEENVVFKEKYNSTFLLKDFDKSWFTCKSKWELESNLLRETYLLYKAKKAKLYDCFNNEVSYMAEDSE